MVASKSAGLIRLGLPYEGSQMWTNCWLVYGFTYRLWEGGGGKKEVAKAGEQLGQRDEATENLRSYKMNRIEDKKLA